MISHRRRRCCRSSLRRRLYLHDTSNCYPFSSMVRLPCMIKNTPFALFAVLLALLTAGCGDGAAADGLVADSEQLRQAATDRFRQQTATVDAMVNSVAGGRSLLVTEVESVVETASLEYGTAIVELETRSERLSEAAGLELDDDYREFLRLLQESNDQLIKAVEAAAEIPATIGREAQAFTGWDEQRAAEVVADIGAIHQRVDGFFEASESLRSQAEQIRE